MSATTKPAAWYDEDRVRQPGSVVLREWMAGRGGAASRALSVRNDARYKLSDREAMVELFQLSTHAGPAVNPNTAMQVTAVYACIALLAGAQAILPLCFFERVDNLAGRKRVKHDLWWLFNEQPSPLIPAAVFWEYVVTCRKLQGDGFALMVRNRAGAITEILPLSPQDVYDIRRTGNRYVYSVWAEDLNGGEPFGVHQDDMLQFYGFGFNPRTGRSRSVISWAARQSIATALAADEFSGRFFSNGAQPSHVITYKGPVKTEAIDSLRQRWAERQAGLANSHKPLVLTHGAELKELSINPEDAQLLATRQFQVEDIARAFGVPPFMIGSTEKTTSWGSGVEAMGMGFIRFTLMRDVRKTEQEINRKCFRTATYFAEFLLDALQRGDLKTRGAYYRQARGGSQGPGWMSGNEIRALEGLEPDDAPESDEIFQGTPAAASGDPAPGEGDTPPGAGDGEGGDAGDPGEGGGDGAGAGDEKNPYAPPRR
jgi:HK97 family phage portal protein